MDAKPFVGRGFVESHLIGLKDEIGHKMHPNQNDYVGHQSPPPPPPSPPPESPEDPESELDELESDELEDDSAGADSATFSVGVGVAGSAATS